MRSLLKELRLGQSFISKGVVVGGYDSLSLLDLSVLVSYPVYLVILHLL